MAQTFQVWASFPAPSFQNLGQPTRGNPEMTLATFQGVGSTGPLTHLRRLCQGDLSRWAKGQQLKEHAVPHSSSLPLLGAKHSSRLGIGEWASGAAGSPF